MIKYPITFKLNGVPVSVDAPPTINLLTLLRDYLNITSPKFGCEQGNCGACTVILDGEAVNSCLVLALTVNGREVTTVEGLGNDRTSSPAAGRFHRALRGPMWLLHAGHADGFQIAAGQEPQPDTRGGR